MNKFGALRPDRTTLVTAHPAAARFRRLQHLAKTARIVAMIHTEVKPTRVFEAFSVMAPDGA